MTYKNKRCVHVTHEALRETLHGIVKGAGDIVTFDEVDAGDEKALALLRACSIAVVDTYDPSRPQIAIYAALYASRGMKADAALVEAKRHLTVAGMMRVFTAIDPWSRPVKLTYACPYDVI